jgi:hypothetical protein
MAKSLKGLQYATKCKPGGANDILKTYKKSPPQFAKYDGLINLDLSLISKDFVSF